MAEDGVSLKAKAVELEKTCAYLQTESQRLFISYETKHVQEMNCDTSQFIVFWQEMSSWLTETAEFFAFLTSVEKNMCAVWQLLNDTNLMQRI
jgi:hypothetical protein